MVKSPLDVKGFSYKGPSYSQVGVIRVLVPSQSSSVVLTRENSFDSFGNLMRELV